MNWNDALQAILNDVVREASEDLVGLWLVQTWVRRAFPEIGSSSVRNSTLAIVARAISGGEILVGSFKGGEFEIWPAQSEAISQIEVRSGVASRDLTVQDNVWLSGRNLGYRTRA